MGQRRGFGTVRKLPSGRNLARYTHPETGVLVSALTTFVAKGDATRFLAEAETDLVPGESLNVANGKQSFASYDDEWLDTRTDLRPKTIYLYRCLFETFLELILGRKEIGRLDARAIRRFDYDPDGRRTGVITPEGLVRPHHRSCLRSS